MRSRLLRGLAMHLQANGIGVWKESGSYSAAEIGITLHAVPQQPDGIITLSAYGVDDDPALSDSIEGVQVRVRRGGANPTPTNDLADRIFNLLHGAHDFRLPSPDDDPGVWVVQCLRRSHVSGGQDQNNRWSDLQNFYITVHYPSANRT